MKIGIILGLIILILMIGFLILKSGEEKGEISVSEKQQIEAWILEQGLNQYGDSKDTVYTGGTPLFDEKTGGSIDKYEYIFKNHLDKPWKK